MSRLKSVWNSICNNWHKPIALFKLLFVYRYAVMLPTTKSIHTDLELYEKIYDWATEHQINDNRWMLSLYKEGKYTKSNNKLVKLNYRFEFRFKRKEDAVLFKLYWLDND